MCFVLVRFFNIRFLSPWTSSFQDRKFAVVLAVYLANDAFVGLVFCVCLFANSKLHLTLYLCKILKSSAVLIAMSSSIVNLWCGPSGILSFPVSGLRLVWSCTIKKDNAVFHCLSLQWKWKWPVVQIIVHPGHPLADLTPSPQVVYHLLMTTGMCSTLLADFSD